MNEVSTAADVLERAAPASSAASVEALRRLPAPAPSLGRKAYKRELWLALATSPRRAWNYYKAKRNAKTSADVDYLPTRMDVENVSRCNFHCTMCQVSDWPKQQRADDMSVEDFKRLLDEQYGVVEIKLQGMGEPTLQGDAFFEMIRLARKRHIWVRTVTNASLLHLKDNYKKLIDSGVNEVQISVDGADKQTFESIRRGSHFESVMRNIKMINAYCAEIGRFPTKMWTVVQRGNVHQLDGLVRLAAELGFKSQVFGLNLVDWGTERWHAINDAVAMHDQFTVDQALELMALGDQLGVTVRFWNMDEAYRTDEPARRCPWPFERAYVSSDMRVVPCCLIANPDALELTNGKSLADAWKSEAYRNFRQAHITGDMPQACRSCYDLRQN